MDFKSINKIKRKLTCLRDITAHASQRDQKNINTLVEEGVGIRCYRIPSVIRSDTAKADDNRMPASLCFKKKIYQ